MTNRIVWAVFLTLGVLALMSTPSYADQVFLCNLCTAPPGGDPNIINPSSFDIGIAGSGTDLAPLLIVIGVPNQGAAPTLSLPSGLNPAAIGTYYGLNNATSGGLTGVLEGTLTSANNGNNDAYTQSGLSGGPNSENWTNWNTFDTAQGVTVGTAFNLYAYAVNVGLSGTLDGFDLTSFTTGSFVIGYGQDAKGNVSATPFTNAGFVPGGSSPPPPPVPEPASLMLLGSGLLALSSKRIFRKA